MQYVHSMNWIVRLDCSSNGGSLWYGNPLTHDILGFNLKLQWYFFISTSVINSTNIIAMVAQWCLLRPSIIHL